MPYPLVKKSPALGPGKDRYYHSAVGGDTRWKTDYGIAYRMDIGLWYKKPGTVAGHKADYLFCLFLLHGRRGATPVKPA